MNRIRRAMLLGNLLFVVPCLAISQVTQPSISEEIIDVQELEATAQDGQEITAYFRAPPGEGPFPAVVMVHGAFATPSVVDKQFVLGNATVTRLLAAGYVPVFATRRGANTPEGYLQMSSDTLAVVEKVGRMDVVDPGSLALYGCSMGGDLVLEMAGLNDVAATVAEEPGVLMLTEIGLKEQEPGEGLNRPFEFYDDEAQELLSRKIRGISSPILIAQGDQFMVDPSFGEANQYTIQNEILIPALEEVGLHVERTIYPGEGHCFGFQGMTTGAKDFFEDMDAFLREHLPVQPKPLDSSILDFVEAASLQ